MMESPERWPAMLEARGRRVVELCAPALGLALASLAGIALFVVTVLSVAFLPLGIGFLTLPVVVVPARGFANLYRRFAAQASGVEIPVPYRPRPAEAGLLGHPGRALWVLRDPATWRDLLWTIVNVPVGMALLLLPTCLVAYGIEGVVVTPFLAPFVDGYHYGLGWWLPGPLEALAGIPQGLLLLAVAERAGVWLVRQHALFTRSLLAPTRRSMLTLRVQQLTVTRSQTVDAQASELRRIERDLHDGAQARLVSLGMSLGMAEALMTQDPEAARRLLAQAREAGGQALAELRDLVRGIHPPVLAERGLDGAVRALALTVALPVEVSIDLPGRAEPPVESGAYFAVAEALANVVKHSGARRAWVRLTYDDGVLTMTVADDGAGGADPARGSGLRGIERRLAAFDGTLSVTSPSGGPTVVTMELPCVLSSPKISPSSGTG